MSVPGPLEPGEQPELPLVAMFELGPTTSSIIGSPLQIAVRSRSLPPVPPIASCLSLGLGVSCWFGPVGSSDCRFCSQAKPDCTQAKGRCVPSGIQYLAGMQLSRLDNRIPSVPCLGVSSTVPLSSAPPVLLATWSVSRRSQRQICSYQ